MPCTGMRTSPGAANECHTIPQRPVAVVTLSEIGLPCLSDIYGYLLVVTLSPPSLGIPHGHLLSHVTVERGTHFTSFRKFLVPFNKSKIP